MVDPITLSKSERTKFSILSAAREVFAERGFALATVRNIADRADADPALVIRYFGNKDGLFAQATQFDLQLPDLDTVPVTKIGHVLIEHFIDLWEDASSGQALTTLLRTSTSNADIADQVREIFQRQVVPALKRVVIPGELAKRSGLVSSQLLGLALSRYVLKLPPLVNFQRDDLISAVGPTLQRYITDKID